METAIGYATSAKHFITKSEAEQKKNIPELRQNGQHKQLQINEMHTYTLMPSLDLNAGHLSVALYISVIFVKHLGTLEQ